MKLGIIDYGSGNLHSVEHALVHAAAEIKGASSIERVTTAAELGMCDQIVLPGVGHFADCRNGLMAVDGMVEASITVTGTDPIRTETGQYTGLAA